MAYNGMPQIPSASQRSLSITASAYRSFATPAITVPFPSAYGGQTQLPFLFTGTATFAATRIPTTLGGVAATAGVHSINSEASAAGYRTHNYGNNGGGSGWPTWATAVIAACGGAALVILVLGLWCWRLRRKQRARTRARAYAAGGGAAAATAGAAEGKKRRKGGPKNGAALTEKSGDGAPRKDRRSRLAQEGALAAVPHSPSKSRSHSRQSGHDSNSSYPPHPPSVSPSRSRARDLAALGNNRPSSASPSPYRQSQLPSPVGGGGYNPELPASGYASPTHAGAYPAFAVPREQRNHQRDFSGSSASGLLPPAAGFAYAEGPGEVAGYQTPPPRRPNTNWDDSPGSMATGSPARLLASSHGRGGGDAPESPRSSFTVSTRGTGGAPYRWDNDQDLSAHMPDADAVSAALGRAMLGPSASIGAGGGGAYAPVGVAVGAPEDAQRWASEEDYHGGEPDGYRERGYDYRSAGAGPGGEGDYDRSTTPSYPPPASSSSHYSASRAPSRQTVTRGGRESAFLAAANQPLPSSHGGHGQGYGRSTTPFGDPPEEHGGGAGGGGGRGMSRASTYRTADEDGGSDDEDEVPSRSYAH
ncbi:hypothetical protein JCM8097_003169 [Rhodosporidiobolus ruineniae]